MRYLLLICMLAIVPRTTWAMEAPSAQIRLEAHQVLRGHFVEEHKTSDANQPIISSGHFLVAPPLGLVWSVEQPFPTSTIITEQGVMQDIGGFRMKLPAKNIHHLFEIVGRALAGDWSGLDQDFILTRAGDAQHWQVTLTPRLMDNSKKAYVTITVKGTQFVENIILTKTDGNYDAFNFTDEVFSRDPLNIKETNAFFKQTSP